MSKRSCDVPDVFVFQVLPPSEEAIIVPELPTAIYLLFEKLTPYRWFDVPDNFWEHDFMSSILDIIPLADDIIKLKGICSICKKNDSIFTHRTVKNDQQVLIGEKDMYMSLCRKCYKHVNI